MSTEKTQETAATKIVGGPVRFSYCHVFQPKKNDLNGKDQYSVALLIPKKNKELIAKIKAGIDAAIEQGIKNVWNGKKPNPSKLKLPLRDGDIEREDSPEYKGMYFLNANCMNRPGIVDENCQKIMDEEDFYSGCWGNFSINFYPFNQKGNTGVGAGLNNLQKTKDDEKLSGGSTAEEDFGKKEDSEDEDNSFM